MQSLSNEVKYKLTPRQFEAWNYMTNQYNCEILYGGAKGGGKSHLFCLWVYYWTEYLIDFFGLKDTKNPTLLGFMGRKQSVDFSHTTLETWKRIIPSDLYKINEQPNKEIIIRGVAKVWFGGLDRSESLNKFNSAELAFIAIDQAEETERKDVSVLEGSLRLKIGDKKPPYKKLYTANPAECWLKKQFLTPDREHVHYVPALFTDNPHLPEDYEETLNNAFGDDKELLRAYKEGDWDVLGRDRIVIPSSYIEGVRDLNFIGMDESEVIACDPSLGGDECPIFAFRNLQIIDSKILHYDDPMKIVGELMMMGSKVKIDNYAIDNIGIGSGISSRLAELDKVVEAIESAESASSDRFYNKRAEMWWYVREKFMNKEIPYPKDALTREQLSCVKFKIVNSNGKILIEPKDDIKKRKGWSPDRGDNFVYGVWASKFFIKEVKDDRVFANITESKTQSKGFKSRYGWNG